MAFLCKCVGLFIDHLPSLGAGGGGAWQHAKASARTEAKNTRDMVDFLVAVLVVNCG
jgi:hypothetical protein